MTEIEIDTLLFRFEDGVEVSKFDEWDFYTKHFQSVFPGRKAIDVLAYNRETTFLIEVKDYRQHTRTKPSDLCQEIVVKVADTLAALIPARINGRVTGEREIAAQSIRRERFRVILHLELGSRSGTAFSRDMNPANVQLKLRQMLRSIDPHVKVVSMSHLGNLPWTVT